MIRNGSIIHILTPTLDSPKKLELPSLASSAHCSNFSTQICFKSLLDSHPNFTEILLWNLAFSSVQISYKVAPWSCAIPFQWTLHIVEIKEIWPQHSLNLSPRKCLKNPISNRKNASAKAQNQKPLVAAPNGKWIFSFCTLATRRTGCISLQYNLWRPWSILPNFLTRETLEVLLNEGEFRLKPLC